VTTYPAELSLDENGKIIVTKENDNPRQGILFADNVMTATSLLKAKRRIRMNVDDVTLAAISAALDILW